MNDIVTKRKKGYTIKALKLLGKEYRKITIDGIGGFPEEDSWKYWLHMRNKGLVDVLLDSYGDEIS